jgi:hypothetical protein
MWFFSKGQPLIIFVFSFPRIHSNQQTSRRASESDKGGDACMQCCSAAALKTNRNRAESEIQLVIPFFEFSPYRLIEIIKVRRKAELSN